jgi:hypothetical protein
MKLLSHELFEGEDCTWVLGTWVLGRSREASSNLKNYVYRQVVARWVYSIEIEQPWIVTKRAVKQSIRADRQ